MDAEHKSILSKVSSLLKNQNHLEAIKLLKPIVEKGSNNEVVLGLLASSYAEVGILDKAKSTFSKILDQHPKNHLARFQLGMIMFNEGDYSGAITHWEKVAIEPKEFVSNFWIAKAYHADSKQEQAKPYINNAHVYVPSDHPLYHDIQILYREVCGAM